MTFCLFCWLKKPFKKEFTLEEKNLPLEEQILSFKNRPPFKVGGGGVKNKNGRVASPLKCTHFP